MNGKIGRHKCLISFNEPRDDQKNGHKYAAAFWTDNLCSQLRTTCVLDWSSVFWTDHLCSELTTNVLDCQFLFYTDHLCSELLC